MPINIFLQYDYDLVMDPVTNYCEAILGDDATAKSSLHLIPELSNCSKELLQIIFRYSKPVNLKPGEGLIQEGLFDQWVYFMIQGELDVVINGKNLGSTAGPIVGERCILGEPRGANLIASNTGVMALGIEMTIVDELYREVNDYRKKEKNKDKVLRFSEVKMAIALELLNIILSEIICRIIDMHRAGVKSFDLLTKSRPKHNIQLQSLYSFADNDFENHQSPQQKPIPNYTATKNIPVYSFSDFVDIVYFEILQKHLYSFGYEKFPQTSWREMFTLDEQNNATLDKAYDWLKNEYQLSNQDLIEVTFSIFEIASKYTAAANQSNSKILAITDCDEEKQKVMDESAIKERVIADQSLNEIRANLFSPIEEKLQSGKSDSTDEESGKMSQSAIDALFG